MITEGTSIMKDRKGDRTRICEQARKYYREHKETILERNKKRRLENPDINKQACKDYYRKHREQLLRKGKEYYQEHLMKIRSYRMKHRNQVLESHSKYYRKNRNSILKKDRAYCQKNREKINVRMRNWRMKKMYGITIEQFESLLAKQENKCAICGVLRSNNRRFSVDHDHKMGYVRGILCHLCNCMIGMSRDNVVILESGIQYLNDSMRKETAKLKCHEGLKS